MLPSCDSSKDLANKFAQFFHDKVTKLRVDLDNMHSDLACPDNTPAKIVPPFCNFVPQTEDQVKKFIMKSPSKSCNLDSIPTWLLKHGNIISVLLPIITRGINSSMSTGIVPKQFKQAIISPILKKPGADIEDMKNYRPVSNLAFQGKLLERIVAKQITHHMSNYSLMDQYQSAYKAGHSVETALLKVKSDIDVAMDNNCGTILVLLDLTAAFDTIDHAILLNRMHSDIGVNGVAHNWFASYLKDRSLNVHVGGAYSSSLPLTTGVPQGSVLGPLLFCIYILPLGDIIDAFGVSRHCYADDTQLYVHYNLNDPESLHQAILKMNTCLFAVRDWLQQNKLKLNESKTEYVNFAPLHYQRKLQPFPPICIGAETIHPSDKARNLGAIFDSEMSMMPHVNSVARKMYCSVRLIKQIRPFLDHASCATLIQCLVTSHLDFNNSLLANCPTSTLYILQKAQNCSARLLTGAKLRDHITPVLVDLHWLPVHLRIVFKLLVLVYKGVNHTDAPSYIANWLVHPQPVRSLRSASDVTKLSVPRTNKSYGDRSFSTAGPTVWNNIPQNIREFDNLFSFRKNLKTYIFKYMFTV